MTKRPKSLGGQLSRETPHSGRMTTMPTRMPRPRRDRCVGRIFDDMLKWCEKHREGMKD